MKEIRDAVKALKHYKPTNNEIAILIDLAEKVLAVGGRVPEKNADHGLCSPYEEQRIFDNGWDMAVDACVLAFAGILTEKEKEAYIKGSNDCHKAWEGKVRG